MEFLLQLAAVIDLVEPDCSRDETVDQRSTTACRSFEFESCEHFVFGQLVQHPHEARIADESLVDVKLTDHDEIQF